MKRQPSAMQGRRIERVHALPGKEGKEESAEVAAVR
jgi:hypothetical protein